MRAGDHESNAAELDGVWWRPSLAVLMALIALLLSVLYALIFSRLIFDSLMEQVFSAHTHLPRYAGPTHYHNSIEWLLLVFPALIGWVGTVGSLAYLARRWLRV